MKVESKPSKRRQGSAATTWIASLERPEREPLSATPVSPAESNKTTWTGNVATCNLSIHRQSLSAILAAESISSEKGFAPYWNEQCAEISSQLWLPTETVLHDSATSLSNGSLPAVVDKSWFSMEIHSAQSGSLPLTCSPYCTSSVVECTDSESTIIKSRLIRIYPTGEQRELLRKWFGAARFIFNKTIEYLRQPGTKANHFEVKRRFLADLPEWAQEVPYQIKNVAVRDGCRAVKAAKKKYRQTGQFQQVKFRSRKDLQQNIFIPESAISSNGVYYTILGNLKLSESLPEHCRDSRLIFRRGRWFLCVSYTATVQRGENQARIVAIDPGIRSFLTFFAETSCGKIGKSDFGRIQRLCAHLDNLISRMAKAKCKQRRRMKKAADRLYWKITDLINELHHKAAAFLCTHFDYILLPAFETSKLVVRGARRLRSKSVRMLLSFAHYRFGEFLKHKAKELGKTVLEVCEAYTSRTISWTGEVLPQMGGRRVVKSKIDGQSMDRDYNGARGIFIKNISGALVDTPLLG